MWPRKLRISSRSINFLSVLSIALGACGGGDAKQLTDGAVSVVDASTQTTDAVSSTDASVSPLRFVLSVSNDVPESIYVQLNEEEGRPSWVRVTQNGIPVILQERCEIIDCDSPSGICGAALPRVKDITGGASTGEITLLSDGHMSVVDSVLDCERLEPLPDGAYTATFCWALSAELQGKENPAGENGAPGTILTPSCTDVSFDLPDDAEIVHTIAGG